MASAKGLAGTVAQLLALGADATLTDEHGKTALDYAKADEVKAALREHGGKHSLFYAVSEGMPELLATLIEEGADAALTDEHGRTALWLACENKNEAAVVELMEATKRAGALDVQGNQDYPCFKRSALHVAVGHGYDLAGTVAKLLWHGADATLTDEFGATALILACYNKNEAAAAELMQATKLAGALDQLSPDNKKSALHFASEKGLAGTVAKLLSLGADAALTDQDGCTAL